MKSALWKRAEGKSVQALAGLEVITTMDELWELPPHAYLIAGGKVWTQQEYLLSQGMSSARNGQLFTGIAKVLRLP